MCLFPFGDGYIVLLMQISQLEDKMLLFDQECQVKIGEEMQLMASQVNTLERIMKEDDE